jgi:histidinol-phosphate aminotransferase
MTVRFRPALGSLPGYVPGRNVPGSVKLASNESAYGPLPSVVARVAELAASANRYPDSFSVELVNRLAERAGVPAGQVVVGCGSVSLCQQLVLATAGDGDEVLFAWRSFEAYPIVSILGGAKPVTVPLRDYVHDLDAMADAITERTRLIFVCNPNNPTGTVVPGPDLIRFLDRVPSDVLVVLDEAYFEFVAPGATADGTSLLGDYPNLIVLRTFSKAYGLAGLRIGYGIAADPTIADAARATQSPFAVTSVAQAAALASLEPDAQQQMHDRVAEVATERERLSKALTAAGYEVPPSMANFLWLNQGEAANGLIDVTGFSAEREASGVIVRAFAGYGVRVSIGSPAENDAFLTGLPVLR